MTIDPCCFAKQLTELLTSLRVSEHILEVIPASMTNPVAIAAAIDGAGDWTLAQALPWLVTGVGRLNLTIARPTLSESTIAAIAELMRATIPATEAFPDDPVAVPSGSPEDPLNSQPSTPLIPVLGILTDCSPAILPILREYLSPYEARIRLAHVHHATHLIHVQSYSVNHQPTSVLAVLGEIPEVKSHCPCTAIITNTHSLANDLVRPIHSLIRVNQVRGHLIALDEE